MLKISKFGNVDVNVNKITGSKMNLTELYEPEEPSQEIEEILVRK